MIIKLDYKTNARIFTAKKKKWNQFWKIYILSIILCFHIFVLCHFFFWGTCIVYNIYHIFYDYFKLFELGLEPSFKNFYWNHLYIIYTIKYFQTNTFLYTQYICRRVKIAQFSRLYSQRHLLDNFSLFLKGYR